MSKHVPRIRLMAQAGFSLLRDSLNISFFIRHPHQEIARGVLHSLEIYLQAMGPRALGRYVDEEGYLQDLNDAEWNRIRRELLEAEWPMFDLRDESSSEYRYGFEYAGKPLGAPSLSLKDEPNAACAVSFWLPTEYLEEHGPERVRELALQLAAPLPFCFGQAGLAFNGATNLMGVMRQIHQRCFRYPGMDIPELGWLSWRMGTKVRGPSWMTFLGQPVLGELGGAAQLRSRLSSLGTTVQEMRGERAVVTLGAWPDAGDTEQGRTLPAYRELARVLEPWLYYETHYVDPDFPPEDKRRWERRFLD
ncbi:hypothetical protein CYFUS_005626 [Cystobacter fuscus]|uniref:DUF3396 domain-containing protein n=1 Tax=Cystobacter fuscus TaxID=43 RepID=A0A250J9E5_9BACT|nr:type VI immunity family protein [Cystobacter fuscus]ATB40178.1 hypothetical protein CYFUS_005626 [Cystobacter fuscus]